MDKREKGNEQYKKLMKTFADSCEGIIYHYTSAEGLRGIIENNEIWLTNTAFVNDTTECKALQEKKDLFINEEFSNEYIREAWFNFIKHQYNRNTMYIISFSRGKESLEQWRAYGNFRIGFETKKLVKSNFNLYECVYHKQEIKDWILEKEKVNEWKGDCLEEMHKKGAAFNLIYVASVKYKNVNYIAEEEIRLIGISHHTWEPYQKSPGMFEKDPPIHFRDHPVYKIPVPYVKFFIGNEEEEVIKKDYRQIESAIQMKRRKLEEEKDKKRELLPIKEILIGPMLNQKDAKIVCEILLCEKGHVNVKVNSSDIPYRGF